MDLTKNSCKPLRLESLWPLILVTMKMTDNAVDKIKGQEQAVADLLDPEDMAAIMEDPVELVDIQKRA